MQKISDTKRLLCLLGGSKHSLGQHFLLRDDVCRRMVKAAQIKKTDTVLEIGPGLGILTHELLNSPAVKILACEKDDKLIGHLKKEFSEASGQKASVILNPAQRGEESLTNVRSKISHLREMLRGAQHDSRKKGKLPSRLKLIHDDALFLIPQLQVTQPLKIVANLPYNISSPAIISLLTVCPTLPETMVLMLQKEVAERLTSKPGNSNRGLLTVLLELMGDCKIIEKIPRNYFYPEPEVESAVILIDNIKPLPYEAKQALKIVKLAFAGKRKKIKNTLFSTLKIPVPEAQKIAQTSEISLDQRPEELTRGQWRKLIALILQIN